MNKSTILELTRQGFFCTPRSKKSICPWILPSEKANAKGKNLYNLPTLTDSKTRCLSNEEWEKVFNSPAWKDVSGVAIAAGGNGVLAFDFDIKHFVKDGNYENKENYDKALEWWDNFKKHVKSNIPESKIYLEKSPSGGEHLIVLCEHGVYNPEPTVNICPIFGSTIRFIECFAEKSNNKLPQSITVAPSEGYRQLSEVSLLNLGRINASERTLLMSYFEKSQVEAKQKEERQKLEQQKEKKQQEKLKKQEAKEYKHKLTHIEIDRYVIQEYGYELIPELERMGYIRHGDRIARPGKSETDLQIRDNGKKIKCYAATDILFNNGNPCDIVDILKINGEHHRLKELRREIIKRYSPHQMTTKIEKAETLEELHQAIHETCKDRLVLNIYQSTDKSQVVIEAITRDGETMFFNKHDFLGHRLEETGFSYFSSEYITSGGSFSPLKTRILNEIEKLKPKILLETSSWKDGKFYSNSSEECYIKHQLIEDSNVSFSEWKTQVFDVAVKSNGTALAMLMGFAAPFVDILHQSFGINFVGDSNIGKTMALRIAKSMYIYPKSLESWRGTASALELQKVFCANSVLCLDEMLHADENALASIMQLCGVTERKRCSWDGTKLNMAMSNEAPLLILSSSEIPFLQMTKRFNIQVTKGQLNRFLDLNVTQDDFLPKQELTQLFSSIKKMYGIPIKTLCEKLEYVNTDLMISEFTEFSSTFTEQLKSMSSASQRVFSHLIFLEFVAKLVGSLLNIDTKAMLSKSKELFARCLDDNIELFSDGDALEIEAIKEQLVLMIASGKYSCPNESGCKANDDTCFYSSGDDCNTIIFCYAPKLIEILKRDLNISKKKIWSIFNTLGLFGVRKNEWIKPLCIKLNIYRVQPLEFLNLTDIKVNNQEDTPQW